MKGSRLSSTRSWILHLPLGSWILHLPLRYRTLHLFLEGPVLYLFVDPGDDDVEKR